MNHQEGVGRARSFDGTDGSSGMRGWHALQYFSLRLLLRDLAARLLDLAPQPRFRGPSTPALPLGPAAALLGRPTATKHPAAGRELLLLRLLGLEVPLAADP